MSGFRINDEDLRKIKRFAELQWQYSDGDAYGLISVYSAKYDIDVVNPWIDASGRFVLTDEQAVAEYGLILVLEFCAKASAFARRYAVLRQDGKYVKSRQLVACDSVLSAEKHIAAEQNAARNNNSANRAFARMW